MFIIRRRLATWEIFPLLALVSLLALALQSGYGQTRRGAEQPPKRALTHNDYDSWRSLSGSQISADGRYIAYSLIPQDGDGEIVVRQIATGREYRQPRGWRQPVPLPDDPEAAQAAVANLNRATRLTFTADSRFLIFTIEPDKQDVLNGRREKKKPEEMPRNALGIINLESGGLSRIEQVKNFQVPENGSGYIAVLLEGKSKPEETTSNEGKEKKEYGTNLVLRELLSGKDSVYSDVSEYSFSKDGLTLLFTVAARDESKNGLFVVKRDRDELAPAVAIVSGKGKYSKLTWNEAQTQLAFLADSGDSGSSRSRFSLHVWDRRANRPLDNLLSEAPGFPAERMISDKAAISFSRDGERLFLGLSNPPAPRSEPSNPTTDEKVVADLWHWKDDFIQPMQKVRASQDRNRSYRAVWHISEGRLAPLADEAMDTVLPSSDGRWAIGQDDRSYRRLVGVDTAYSDVYLVNTKDGSRSKLREKNQFGLSWSPLGNYALFYDGRHWNSIAIPTGQITNLTSSIGVNFWQEDHDTPNTPPPYGIAGWTKDDKEVLLYDQYDIWQVSPDGLRVNNLTGGAGRRDRITFRYARLDPEERWIEPGSTLLLRAEDQKNYDTGFYRVKIGTASPEKLVMAAKSFSPPIRAKNSNVLLLSASRFDEYPDLLTTDENFKDLRKVSTAGDQKDRFLWGKAELISFRNTDGVELSGILIKPDNFDPRRKYPLMVYIYEKLSDGLHRFVNPAPGTSINPSYYVSNGYVVLMPDIVYRIGYPGASALNCVLPAVQAVVDRGFIQENAIGIQGHSWGGYQIAYMVTQTSRFRAAAPGAVVGNMTSAYSGIRWGTGLPRQFQYERTQSRIGGSIWEYPMRFIENSPIFQAHRVETPILMVHNDNDDAVPWYQGIEYFLALRRLNKEAYMFNYNGEYHGLRKRHNQKDYTRRLQEFFDHHLRGAKKPEWMERGIPWLERELPRSVPGQQ